MADEDEVACDINLYDSEVLVLEGVLKAINEARNKVNTVEGWRNEVEGRLHAAGFKVTVVLRNIHQVEQDGVIETLAEPRLLTSITITGRVNAEGEFDHDRQRHEVQSDLLKRNPQGSVAPVKVAVTKSGLYVPGS